MIGSFKGCNELTSRVDIIFDVKFYFIIGIFAVDGIIHFTEVLPIIEGSGFRVTNGEIRIDCSPADLQGTFIPKGNVIGE